MNQSDEIEHPYEGQKFTSFDALKKYLEEYGQKTFVKFWIRSSQTRNSLKSKISKTMNPDLKYVSIKFACIFGGEKIRCRGSGIRKSSTYRNLGCPCMINAVVGEDGNHVKLDTVILEHNHVLCKTLYDSIRKSKRKAEVIDNSKEFIEDNILMNSQDLELGNNGNNDEISFSSPVDDKLKFQDICNDQSKTDNSEEAVISMENLDSTKNCLRDIKDKYGRNIKILVINSESLNNEVKDKSKDDEIKDEIWVSDDAEEDVISTAYSNVCRLCLSSKHKLSPIFNPDLPLKSTVLSFKIMGCASIEISAGDGLPNNICSACEANLDIAYNFRIRCENSDSVLRKACLRNDILRTSASLSGISEKFIKDEVNEDNVFQEISTNYSEENDALEETVPENDTGVQDSLYVQFAVSCPVCGTSFERYETMLGHLETHSEDENVLMPCSICNEMCPTVRELQEHISEHLKEPKTEQSACNQCEMTFATAKELKLHKESHDQGKKSDVNYLCNVCGKILKSKDRFQAHKNTHEGLRPHVCLKCGRGFADRKNMHQHYDVVHLRRVKHECPVCQKKFYTRTKMKSHITMHYGVKPFACDVCNKTFRLKMNMIKHKKTHSNDRPHQCDKCNAAFIDKNMLKRHSYIHGGIRPYPCPVCGHRFSVKFHLKKHLEKSKCSKGAVIKNENYQWVGMTQPNSNLTDEECVVVYKANEENELQPDSETVTINMDILQGYNEEPNS